MRAPFHPDSTHMNIHDLLYFGWDEHVLGLP